MLHELALHLAEELPSQETPLGTIAGLLIAVSSVIGAATGLIIGLRGRGERIRPIETDPPPSTSPIPLNSDSVSGLIHQSALEARTAVLESVLMRLGVNPNRIETGDEPLDALRIEH